MRSRRRSTGYAVPARMRWYVRRLRRVQLGPEDDFAEWFHGVDERIPVEGFRFGVKALGEVLDRLMDRKEGA